MSDSRKAPYRPRYIYVWALRVGNKTTASTEAWSVYQEAANSLLNALLAALRTEQPRCNNSQRIAAAQMCLLERMDISMDITCRGDGYTCGVRKILLND